MEHNALDFTPLREFMRGLVEAVPPAAATHPGGIRRNRHHRPGRAYVRANSWVIQQLLDCGIHGIHQCHARDTKAVQVTIRWAAAIPSSGPGSKLPMRGLRGSAPGYAAQIWGVNLNKYLHVADLWPLNPKGELIFGVKIEDTYADQQVEDHGAARYLDGGMGTGRSQLLALWPGSDAGRRLAPPDIIGMPEMVAVRKKVLDLCKKNKVMFLNAGTTDQALDYVIGQIKDGAMVLECGEEAAIKGREYTKRKMPV